MHEFFPRHPQSAEVNANLQLVANADRFEMGVLATLLGHHGDVSGITERRSVGAEIGLLDDSGRQYKLAVNWFNGTVAEASVCVAAPPDNPEQGATLYSLRREAEAAGDWVEDGPAECLILDAQGNVSLLRFGLHRGMPDGSYSPYDISSSEAVVTEQLDELLTSLEAPTTQQIPIQGNPMA